MPSVPPLPDPRPLSVVAVVGSLHSPSRTAALVDAILAAAGRLVPIETRVVLISRIGPSLAGTLRREELPAEVRSALEDIEAADLLIAASPVYRASYTGLFKHLFDYVDQFALVNTPVLLAATGGSQRHSLMIEHQLRPLFGFFQALTLPLGVYASHSEFTEYDVTDPLLLDRITDAVRLGLALVPAGLAERARGAGARGAGRVTVLVGVEDLASALAGARPPRVLDVRWRLGGPPGRGEYAGGHLPGAVFADLDGELSGPPAPGAGRHPLPDPADLQRAARRWGLNRGEPVVVYDGGSGSAARGWWVLRWAGVGDVRLLDGGLHAWTDSGRPLATGDGPVPPAGDVVLTTGALPVLDPDGVTLLVAGGGLLLDARPGERYRGEVSSVDPAPGHIPGAVSAPTTDNLDGEGRFLPPHVLAERFAALGAVAGRPVAVYCGSGVTAAHEIAALAVAGIDAALYPGSWSQWATLPGRPVATGTDPG